MKPHLEGWCVQWRSGPDNVDRKARKHFVLFDYRKTFVEQRGNFNVMFFPTRALARAFAKERYGYIARRADLRKYPHDWRSPLVLKCTMEIKKCPKIAKKSSAR